MRRSEREIHKTARLGAKQRVQRSPKPPPSSLGDTFAGSDTASLHRRRVYSRTLTGIPLEVLARSLGFAGVLWCSRATRRKCPTNGSVCRVPHAMSQSPLIGISEDSEEFRGISPKRPARKLRTMNHPALFVIVSTVPSQPLPSRLARICCSMRDESRLEPDRVTERGRARTTEGMNTLSIPSAVD